MANKQRLLQVDAEQRNELESWGAIADVAGGEVFRARLILGLADGMSYREIERQLGASAANPRSSILVRSCGSRKFRIARFSRSRL